MVVTIIFILTVIGNICINAQHTISSNDFESVDYFSPETNCNVLSPNAEDNLLFRMHVIDILSTGLHQILSTNDTVKQSILYWLHLSFYNSSFLYNIDIDTYTSNLWNEYCLYFLSISNNYKTITLNINSVILQMEIAQIMSKVLETNGNEISDYIRSKLTDVINNYHSEITVNVSLYVDLMLVSPTTTENPSIIYEKTTNIKIYILIIAVCMFIVTIFLCVYKRIQKSIKDIESLVFIRHKLFNLQSGQSTQQQQQQNEIISEPISIKSISDVTNTTNQMDDNNNNNNNNNNNSPAIPVMNVNIFSKPLPLMMQKGPSSDSLSNLTVIPPKQKSKSLIDISFGYEDEKNESNLFNTSKKQILYDYNGNISDIKDTKRKRTIIDQQNANSTNKTNEQKNSIISYDDNAQIGSFKIIDDHELGHSLFDHVVTD